MDETVEHLTDEFLLWCYRVFGLPWVKLDPRTQDKALSEYAGDPFCAQE